MRSRKGVGKGRVSQWWVILAVVVMFLGSPAGTLKAVTVSFIAERDQTRLAAERAFAEAERLADQKNVDAIRQAIAKYAEAARLYHTLGERGKVAECVLKVGVLYLLLGNVYSDLGEKQKALEYYTQALAIIALWGIGPGKPRRSTTSARCTTISARSRRRWSTTLRRWPSIRAVGDRAREAATLNNIGKVYFDLGEKQKALEYFTQALALRRVVGDRAGEATTLNNIGKVYSDLGEKQKALEYYTQALASTISYYTQGWIARGGSGRGSHDAQQHRRGVRRSRREAEGAGVLHSSLALVAPWGIGPEKPRRSTISARCTSISARSGRRVRRWQVLTNITQALGPRIAPWGIGPGNSGRSST
jgi:tetratricopeptide (TPR) repeat protein